jgi:hypothetical protein
MPQHWCRRMGYEFDFNVFAGSDRGIQFVKVLAHLLQIQVHNLRKLYRPVSHHFVHSVNVHQRRSRGAG